MDSSSSSWFLRRAKSFAAHTSSKANETSKRVQAFLSLKQKDNPFAPNNSSSSSSSNPPTPSAASTQAEVLHQFGVTDQLHEFLKTFTLNTFKDFPLQDQRLGSEAAPTAGNVQQDLNEWQERHATLVLSTVKEISHLRYVLCPRHLKERQFWRIYFQLVKSYVIPYEIQYVQQCKLRSMGAEEKEMSTKTTGFEVEMVEANQLTTDLDSFLLGDLENGIEGGGNNTEGDGSGNVGYDATR